MRAPVVMLLGLGLAAAGGCRNCDLVEAELRSRESQVRELQDQVYRAESYNNALEHELRDLRQHSTLALSPEKASQIYTLKEITLGRQTGGYDEDNLPGDEALQVVLEPRDPDGQAIKAPGSVHVTALEKNPEGVKTPLDSWDMTPEQLRRTWRSGLFSTGYFLILPWKHWPTSPKLRVEVQFTLADGRLFEADKDITIHLRPESSHPAPPAFQPMEPPPHHLNPDPDAAPPGKEDPGPLLGQRMPPPVAAWKGLVIESTSLRVNESLSGAAQLLPPVAGR